MFKGLKTTLGMALASVLLATSMSLHAVTLDQAVAQVRAQTNGKVLSAQTVRKAGGRVHRIKVLTPKGKVRIVEIPAGNGR